MRNYKHGQFLLPPWFLANCVAESFVRLQVFFVNFFGEFLCTFFKPSTCPLFPDHLIILYLFITVIGKVRKLRRAHH